MELKNVDPENNVEIHVSSESLPYLVRLNPKILNFQELKQTLAEGSEYELEGGKHVSVERGILVGMNLSSEIRNRPGGILIFGNGKRLDVEFKTSYKEEDK